MLKAVFAALALVLLAGQVQAQTESGAGKVDLCATREVVKRDVAAFPFPATATELTAEQTKAFLDRFNAMPPASDLRADTIIVVIAPSKPQVVLALFVGGCVTRTVYLPISVFVAAMGTDI